ncbi:MAG TPA: TolC family protein, partial [Chlamydiales bacterium]|nr:TolC family protein [Chlamydiales bacterium]
TIISAYQEVENALAHIETTSKEFEIRNRELQAAKKIDTLTHEKYAAGIIDYTVTLEAERTRLEAERLCLQNQSDRLIATVELIRGIGGAW